METLRFIESEKIRKELTQEQLKLIRKMYRAASKNVKADIERLNLNDTPSSIIQENHLKEIQKNIDKQLDVIRAQLKNSISGAMTSVSETVVAENNDIMKNLGLSMKGAYSDLPSEIIEKIITGQIYQSDWSLSKALWGHTKKAKNDINTILAQGLALNKSTYEIAKDLEKYVNPSAVKPWDWSKMYPGVNKVVDYNAQRLANTLISHAYQQSFIETTKDNPFITGYKWLTSNSHRRTCQVCLDRASQNEYHLGAGVFPKDSLPLDHPNGLCTFSIVMKKSLKDISDEIADWYKKPEGTYPELDKYAKSFGYSPKTKKPIKTPEDYLKEMYKGTKINLKKAKEVIDDWSDGAAYDIRLAQQLGYKSKEGDFIENLIKSAKSQRGIESEDDILYRGIIVDDVTLKTFLRGGYFNMKGTSSWSKSSQLADTFANQTTEGGVLDLSGANNKIVFRVTGISPDDKITLDISNVVDPMYISQQEVIISKKASFYLDPDYIEKDKNGTYIIDLIYNR